MKRIISICFVLCLLSALATAAYGQNADVPFVTDEAGLLTQSQFQDLEAKAQKIAEEQNFEIYILTLEDFTRDGSRRIDQCAIDFYEANGLGAGENHEGATFLLSMANRDYDFTYNGPRGDLAFTETGRDKMEQTVLPYISQGDYYGGFNAYLDLCETYLTAQAQGEAIGYGTDHSKTGEIAYGASEPDKGFSILFFVPGLLAAIITGIVTTVPMRSARKKTDASGYSSPGGGLRLQVRQDTFLRKTVTRTPKPEPSSSGSHSGSSYHHSSGSHSGRSGKF